VGQAGFFVTGHKNLLLHNSVPVGPRFGFYVTGNKNLLVDNDAEAGFGEGGLLIFGDNNVLLRNTVKGSDPAGILVSGEGNIIVHNTALENTIDLLDEHENCDGNVWQRNTFETSQAGGTENPACIR
jgi:parallel beta-helix repeat protein